MSLPRSALARIDELVSQAPPLSPEMCARLAVILGSATDPGNDRAPEATRGGGGQDTEATRGLRTAYVA